MGFFSWWLHLHLFMAEGSRAQMSAIIIRRHFKTPRDSCRPEKITSDIGLTFWCWTFCRRLLFQAARLREVAAWCWLFRSVGRANTLHTLYTYAHTHTQGRQGGGTKGDNGETFSITVGSHSSPLNNFAPPWPARAARPLSQSNWLGMAGGNEQSLTRPPQLRGESNVTFNNYLLCSQHNSHFVTEWNSLAPTVTQDEAKGQKTITNNLIVRGASRQLNITV